MIILIILVIIFIIIYPSLSKDKFKSIKAVSVLKNDKINGVIYLEELSFDKTRIYGKVTGLKPNSEHAIHIHESGNLTDGCKSACAHYNPFNKKHGGPKDTERHVGDLGNLITNNKGETYFELIDKLVKLRGDYSVIGRSIIIHADPDDLGRGGHSDSHTTGHAGIRLVCGVIGYVDGC
jgi:Cu-Zn family superoxide dismutase